MTNKKTENGEKILNFEKWKTKYDKERKENKKMMGNAVIGVRRGSKWRLWFYGG